MAREKHEPPEMDIFCEDETVCPICQAEFIDIDDLQTHILQVHQAPQVKPPQSPGSPQSALDCGKSEYQKHQCRFCNDFFASALEFAMHIRDSHIVNMRTCAFCVRAFVTRQNLWDHEAKHNLTNSSMFSCAECPMIFTDLSDLEYHELNCHEEGPGMMLQPYYPELSSVLRCHADWLMHNIGTKINYKCVCKYSTNDIQVYVKHVQKEKCNCLVCNECNKVFTSKQQITRHVKEIKCEPLKNTNVIKCPNCYKVVHKKDIKVHKRRCKAVHCATCELNFDTLSELAAHKQANHFKKSISLKECRYCSKSIVGLEMFKKHIETQHKNDYLKFKYNCVYCDKIFDHPQRLFAHFHGAHRNVRPFACNICHQNFLLRSKFTYHIKLAHDSKGYVEFTKDLNVHFNAEKSPDVVTLTPPASLFTAAEVEELKKNGIEIKPTPIKSHRSKVSNNLKRSRLVKKETPSLEVDNQTASEDNSNVELSEDIPEETEETMVTKEEEFQSSDEEPIKKKKKRRGRYMKNLICNICEQRCFTIENYKRHMLSHKNNNGLKECLKCDKKFKTISLLKIHIQKKHTTSLIKTLRTIVEQRKQKVQPQVTVPKKADFLCNIQKVYIEPDYRPTAQVTLYQEGDARPAKPQSTDVDKVLLRILSEKRAFGKTRPLIVMQKCTLENTVEPPKKGINIQKCETIYSPIKKYNSAKLETWKGPARKPKFDFSVNAIDQHGDDDDGGYYDNEIITYDDIITTHEETVSENIAEDNSTVKNITNTTKAEVFMLPSVDNQPLDANSTLLIPNEQTKKFGKINIATMYYTQNGKPSYKIVPFDISQQETEEEAEVAESEVLPGGPKLIQSNPLAHLMGINKLLKPQPGKKYKYKPRLQNPQLKIAQALMELKVPHTRKKQIRPPKGKHFKKTERPENCDAFQYEILDEDAENWAMISED